MKQGINKRNSLLSLLIGLLYVTPSSASACPTIHYCDWQDRYAAEQQREEQKRMENWHGPQQKQALAEGIANRSNSQPLPPLEKQPPLIEISQSATVSVNNSEEDIKQIRELLERQEDISQLELVFGIFFRILSAVQEQENWIDRLRIGELSLVILGAGLHFGLRLIAKKIYLRFLLFKVKCLAKNKIASTPNISKNFNDFRGLQKESRRLLEKDVANFVLSKEETKICMAVCQLLILFMDHNTFACTQGDGCVYYFLSRDGTVEKDEERKAWVLIRDLFSLYGRWEARGTVISNLNNKPILIVSFWGRQEPVPACPGNIVDIGIHALMDMDKDIR